VILFLILRSERAKMADLKSQK